MKINLEYYNNQADFLKHKTSHTNISIEALQKQLGFTWIDNIEVIDNPKATAQVQTFLSSTQLLNTKALSIAMVELDAIGCAVFSLMPIKKNTHFIYAGQIWPLHAMGIDPYFFRVSKHNGLSALDAGNFTRFFVDLPSDETLHTLYHFDPTNAAPNIATANFKVEYIQIPGLQEHIMLLTATRDIAPNEILGFEYGKDYWRGFSHLPQRLLSKTGECIDVHQYTLNHYEILIKLPFTKDGIRSIPLTTDEISTCITKRQPYTLAVWSERDAAFHSIDLTPIRLLTMRNNRTAFDTYLLSFDTYFALTDHQPLDLARSWLDLAQAIVDYTTKPNPCWALIVLKRADELLHAYRRYQSNDATAERLHQTVNHQIKSLRHLIKLKDKRVILYQRIFPELNLDEIFNHAQPYSA